MSLEICENYRRRLLVKVHAENNEKLLHLSSEITPFSYMFLSLSHHIMKRNKFFKQKNMAKWVLKTSNNYYNLYAAFSPRQTRITIAQWWGSEININNLWFVVVVVSEKMQRDICYHYNPLRYFFLTLKLIFILFFINGESYATRSDRLDILFTSFCWSLAAILLSW